MGAVWFKVGEEIIETFLFTYSYRIQLGILLYESNEDINSIQRLQFHKFSFSYILILFEKANFRRWFGLLRSLFYHWRIVWISGSIWWNNTAACTTIYKTSRNQSPKISFKHIYNFSFQSFHLKKMLNFAAQTCPAVAAKISPMSASGKTAVSFFSCQAKFSLKNLWWWSEKNHANNQSTHRNHCFVMVQILICTDLKYFFKNMYVNQISEYFFFSNPQ